MKIAELFVASIEEEIPEPDDITSFNFQRMPELLEKYDIEDHSIIKQISGLIEKRSERKYAPALPLSQEDYVRFNSARCPFCFSENIEGTAFDTDGAGASQDCFCNDCEGEWLDIYTLSNYVAK